MVFLAAAAVVYGPIWRAGAGEAVPVPLAESRGGAVGVLSDTIFQVWLVSRNARTLATAPHRLFDTEHCAPAEKTLTLGIPMVTLGALAIPAFLVTRDPLRTWNTVLVLLSLIGALAMYALVLGWTGSAGAGIAAGLLFAFHPMRLNTIAYPSVWDGTWTVFALLFAERLFDRGRWRDAVGLSAATILQVGASFYPLVAAVLLASPFLVWLLVRGGPGRVSRGQLAFVLGTVAVATAWLLGPYLFAETGLRDGRFRREVFFYLRPWQLAPGSYLFPGWSMLGLVAFALAARRAWVLPRLRGDPRWALLAGAVLAALVALGSNAGPLPNLHRLLGSVLPGLDAVRVVLRIFSGTQLAFALLAGVGAAALIRLSGRAGLPVAATLVLVCGIEMLGAPRLGIERTYRWTQERIRPDPEEIAFFQKLARLGNDGPLLEIPVEQSLETFGSHAPRILISFYHRRRTSTCFGSYPPPGRERLEDLASRLPEPAVVAELSALGFTTVIFRHPSNRPAPYAMIDRLGRASERGAGVEHIHSSSALTAFGLRPEAE